MIWAQDDASDKEKAIAEKKISKSRAKIFAFFSRLGPGFAFGKKMKSSPKEAPVIDGIVKGSDNLRGEISDDPIKGKMKGIPTVSLALKPPDLYEGKTFLSKIKESVLAPFKLFLEKKPPIRGISNYAGKRGETITTLHRGRPWGWKRPRGKPKDIHLPATIRSAARKQGNRETSKETTLTIFLEDACEKLRLYKAPMTLVFVIDLSGSMLFSIEEAKEALLKLHRDAYRYRDKVGIVALKETRAVVVQHPITNLGVVANKLLQLKISGFTPLAAGMLKAREVLKETRRRDKAAIPVMVIITDGNANVPLYRSLETGETRKFNDVGIVLRRFEDLAIKDVVSVSKMIKREGIHTTVVNTNPHLAGRESYGFIVTKIISSITKGSHHQISRFSEGKERMEEIFEGISEDQKKIIHGVSLSTTNLWDLS
ncbi:MAG: VWA domain-containing protein [Promethearchaeota archaeon]